MKTFLLFLLCTIPLLAIDNVTFATYHGRINIYDQDASQMGLRMMAWPKPWLAIGPDFSTSNFTLLESDNVLEKNAFMRTHLATAVYSPQVSYFRAYALGSIGLDSYTNEKTYINNLYYFDVHSDYSIERKFGYTLGLGIVANFHTLQLGAESRISSLNNDAVEFLFSAGTNLQTLNKNFSKMGLSVESIYGVENTFGVRFSAWPTWWLQTGLQADYSEKDRGFEYDRILGLAGIATKNDVYSQGSFFVAAHLPSYLPIHPYLMLKANRKLAFKHVVSANNDQNEEISLETSIYPAIGLMAEYQRFFIISEVSHDELFLSAGYFLQEPAAHPKREQSAYQLEFSLSRMWTSNEPGYWADPDFDSIALNLYWQKNQRQYLLNVGSFDCRMSDSEAFDTYELGYAIGVVQNEKVNKFAQLYVGVDALALYEDLDKPMDEFLIAPQAQLKLRLPLAFVSLNAGIRSFVSYRNENLLLGLGYALGAGINF